MIALDRSPRGTHFAGSLGIARQLRAGAGQLVVVLVRAMLRAHGRDVVVDRLATRAALVGTHDRRMIGSFAFATAVERGRARARALRLKHTESAGEGRAGASGACDARPVGPSSVDNLNVEFVSVYSLIVFLT